jgi:hypothetical protein
MQCQAAFRRVRASRMMTSARIALWARSPPRDGSPPRPRGPITISDVPSDSRAKGPLRRRPDVASNAGRSWQFFRSMVVPADEGICASPREAPDHRTATHPAVATPSTNRHPRSTVRYHEGSAERLAPLHRTNEPRVRSRACRRRCARPGGRDTTISDASRQDVAVPRRHTSTPTPASFSREPPAHVRRWPRPKPARPAARG